MHWENLSWLEEIDQDEETNRHDILQLVAIFITNKQKRSIKWKNDRLNWNEHVQRELHTKTFEPKYHMPLRSFSRLVHILLSHITIDVTKSRNSTSGNDPIYPELIVAIGLRYLGGEMVKSLEDIFGVDDASVARVINLFFDAVLTNDSLQIRMPQSAEEFKDLADGFNALSGADGLFHGCIGALDGWLCCTVQPRDVTNQRDYFSGHYQCFGLNIQAICDHKLRFIFFAVTSPGKTGDARAFNKCIKLGRWIDAKLKNTGFFLVGDNAYVLRDELLIPFSGSSITEVQRTYNFFLSQLRIRIEMAFGRLTTKWRIFRRKLENGTKRNSIICRVAAVLHNFVINEMEPMEETAEDFVAEYPGAANGLGYLPTFGDDEDTSGNYINSQGVSQRREAFVRIVQAHGMNRPTHNILRNGIE